jgi:two-component system LytT family response regulator
MAEKIRVLIVDDEPLAREKIRGMLRGKDDFEVAGEASNGREAITAVRKLHPDLLFLDVQMPEVDGFGVIESLDPAQIPLIIFVTAYDRYALQAFEVYALDYLLKPFDRERFEKSLDRAKAQLEQDQRKDLTKNIQALMTELSRLRKTSGQAPAGSPSRIAAVFSF